MGVRYQAVAAQIGARRTLWPSKSVSSLYLPAQNTKTGSLPFCNRNLEDRSTLQVGGSCNLVILPAITANLSDTRIILFPVSD